MASEKLQVILELVTGQYKREAREAATATGGIAGAVSSVTGSLGRFLGPAAIGGAVVALGKMAYEAGQNADRLFDLQAQTNLSTDALQEWEFVAAAAGATSEAFSDAVKAIIKNLSEAANGTGAAADAYETLGIKVLDTTGNLRDAGSITDEVFSKLAGMSNITERNALAQDIFGKKWEETVSILDLGTEALGDLREEGQKATISAASLRNADKFRESMDKLKVSAEAAATKGLAVFLPLLIGITDELGESAGLFGEASGFFEELGRAMSGSSEDAAAAKQAYDETHGALGFLGFGIEDTLRLFAFLGDELEENRVASEQAAAAARFMADAQKDDLIPVVFDTIAMLDNQYASHRNVARAAETQRTAMINLANTQADLLDPVSNVLRLQKDLREAQERLTAAQEDGKTPAEDLALAAIEVEQAFLRLQGAGAALTPDQIQAFSLILINELGMSEEQALRTLDALNLLDGWTGTASFTLEMNKIASGGGSGGGNINSVWDEIGFDSGGVIPGPKGSPQIVLAHAGETILPTHKAGGGGMVSGPTINVYSPTNNLQQDLQYATILASVTNLVEGM